MIIRIAIAETFYERFINYGLTRVGNRQKKPIHGG